MLTRLASYLERAKDFFLSHNIYVDIILILIFVIGIYLLSIFQEAFIKPHIKKVGEKIKSLFAKKQKKLDTVHVFLPLTGGAKGDGLIQAAGFLKAAEDFKDDLTIKLHDTEYSSQIAIDEMKKIINNWKIGDPPLAIVATMSRICYKMAEEAKKIIEDGVLKEEKIPFWKPLAKKKYTELKKSFSMILTVAFSPKVPHYPLFNIYKFTVNADNEASFIKHKVLRNQTCYDFDLEKPLILCSTTSDYPASATGELTRKILKHQQTKPIVILPFNEEGELEIYGEDLNLSSYEQAIVFAYDKYIFNIFRYLIQHRFNGKVLCPTTFSVEDWQQIWLDIENNEKLPELDYFYLEITNIKHIEPVTNFDSLAHSISNHLCSDDSNVNSNSFYETYKEQFTEEEKTSYDKIDKNYISDLCYESIFFFYEQSKKNLPNFNFSKLKSAINTNKKIPIRPLENTNAEIWIANEADDTDEFQLRKLERQQQGIAQ